MTPIVSPIAIAIATKGFSFCASVNSLRNAATRRFVSALSARAAASCNRRSSHFSDVSSERNIARRPEAAAGAASLMSLAIFSPIVARAAKILAKISLAAKSDSFAKAPRPVSVSKNVESRSDAEKFVKKKSHVPGRSNLVSAARRTDAMMRARFRGMSAV